jgi:serine/threonine protein kinase
MSTLLRTSSHTFGPPEILPEDIELLGYINQGQYGAVYRALCRGHEVAVKIPKEQYPPPKQLEEFKQEVNIMSMNTHPNVVRLMGACTTPGKLQIVTERCHGDVDSLLQDPSYKGTLFDRLKIARDTADGMNWLHELTHTVHGDLKPANLLIDIYCKVKIADFGFGQIRQDMRHEATVKGSAMWLAPEKILKNKPISEKIDVYSFGIILWEIVQRQKPYRDEDFKDMQDFCEAICLRHVRPPLTPDIPASLQELMVDCWHADPDRRPSFSDIVSRLNFILVDCIITTPSASAFWKTKVIQSTRMMELKEYTEWDPFCRLLLEEIGPIDEQALLELHNLLVQSILKAGKIRECVTIERFNQVEKWFGPFYKHPEGPFVINMMVELLRKPWFHGEIDAGSADRMLAGHPDGTYLIRLSTSGGSAHFTLSTLRGHFQIARVATGGYTILGTHYPSLEALLAGNRNKLRNPCPKVAPVVVQAERYPVAF